MTRKKESAKAPTQRQLKVGEEIRRVLAAFLQKGELHEPALDGFKVIISEVRISPDFSSAKVFVAPLSLEGGNMKDLIAKLEEHKGALRKHLGHTVRLRVTPDLTFLPDTSFAEAGHIEDLLQSPEVQRDL